MCSLTLLPMGVDSTFPCGIHKSLQIPLNDYILIVVDFSSPYNDLIWEPKKIEKNEGVPSSGPFENIEIFEKNIDFKRFEPKAKFILI